MNSRLLPIEGTYNLRDLGGHIGADGKTVKMRKLFRSDDLGNITDKGLLDLAGIPMRTYVDFRDPKEVAELPDRVPTTVGSVHLLHIDVGSVQSFQEFQRLPSVSAAKEVMKEIYGSLVIDFQPVYTKFLDLVSHGDNPLLFHCAAGKDRTGFAAALVLSALGVSQSDIMDDYMLSNKYLANKYTSLTSDIPEMQPLYSVHREYLEHAFDIISQSYGGMEKYLSNNLNLDIYKLRELYLL